MRTDTVRRYCFECNDLGFVLKDGIKHPCWRLWMPEHPDTNAAAVMLERAIDHLHERKLVVDHHAFELAKVLTQYTSDRPFDKGNVLTTHLAQSLRSFQGLIEHLRKVWLLPVGSRKFKPHGYWIITEQADFAAWIQREKAAPLTQLATIRAVAKRNFPVFAEQLELEFGEELLKEAA